jgi:hypothetical protein
MANGLHGKNLAQSETLCMWRRSLRGGYGGLAADVRIRQEETEVNGSRSLILNTLGSESRPPPKFSVSPAQSPASGQQLAASIVERLATARSGNGTFRSQLDV